MPKQQSKSKSKSNISTPSKRKKDVIQKTRTQSIIERLINLTDKQLASVLEKRIHILSDKLLWSRPRSIEDEEAILYLLFGNYDDFQYQDREDLEKYVNITDNELLALVKEAKVRRDEELELGKGIIIKIGGKVFKEGQIQKRIRVLAKFLKDEGIEDIEEIDVNKQYNQYGLLILEFDLDEYIIGTKNEADEAVKEALKEILWEKVDAKYIIEFCELPPVLESVLDDFIESKEEEANDIIIELIELQDSKGGLDAFTKKIIEIYGRGTFLNSWDGEEYQEGNFYIYRI